MTTKDLNLSFDQGMLQAQVAQNLQSTFQDAMPGDFRPENQRRDKKHDRVHSARPQRSWTAVAAIGMTAANMLFLAVTGLWLTGHIKLPTAGLPYSPADIGARLESAQAGLDIRIGSIEQQLANLLVSLDTQQQLIITTYQEIDHRMRQEVAAAASADGAVASEDESTAEEPDPVMVNENNDWFVNLGNFSDKKAAVDVQSQLETLGFQAQIESLNVDNEVTHKVTVPNFENRSSAEIAANTLMEQTELDSLSVWRGS